MKRRCDAVDGLIKTTECGTCEEDNGLCEGEFIPEAEDRLIAIYSKIFPYDCYVDFEQAYTRIIEWINTKNI